MWLRELRNVNEKQFRCTVFGDRMWFLNINGSFPLLPIIRINIASEREQTGRLWPKSCFLIWKKSLSGPHLPRPLLFISRYSGVKRDEITTSQHLYHLCRHKCPRGRKSLVQLAISCKIFYPGNTWTLSFKGSCRKPYKRGHGVLPHPIPTSQRQPSLSDSVFSVFDGYLSISK